MTPKKPTNNLTHAHAHAADHAHDHAHVMDGHAHGSFRSYTIGFILSVILTAIPFWLVMTKQIDNAHATAAIIMALAFVQIVVHMIYFLHMNSKSEGGWTMMALMFTAIVVVITLTGSMWVMYHMDTNMMPMSADAMRNMP